MPLALNRSRQDRILAEQVLNGLAVKTTTYSMTVYDTLVKASISAGSWTLTLPPVAEAAGRTYIVRVSAAAGSGAAPNVLTIQDKSQDSVRWSGDVKLYRTGQYVIFMSDGERWFKQYQPGTSGRSQEKYMHEMFLTPFTLTPNLGTGVGTADTTVNMIVMPNGNSFVTRNVNGQALYLPLWVNPGLNIGCDQVDTDGIELNPGVGTNSPFQFVIGTDRAFFCRARIGTADGSAGNPMMVGFRKLEAFQALYTGYADYAGVGLGQASAGADPGAINIMTGLAGTDVKTDTTQTWADAAIHSLAVFVSKAGVVTFQVDDAAPTATYAYTFTSALTVIPFIRNDQNADLSGALVIYEWEVGYQ